MPQATQTRVVEIKVKTDSRRALNRMAKEMGVLNKQTKSMAGNMNLLTNAFRGWLGFHAIRSISRLADEMQNIENRLKTSISDGKTSAEVMQEIGVIARRTYQPINEVGVAYARMGTALKNAGASTEELGALTEALINTFRVSGATTQETINTMIQISQAFASGELRGQELRSVMEQNAYMAVAIRKAFGADVYKEAAKGTLRASTMTKILIDNLEDLEIQARKLKPTFEQTVNVAMNDMVLALHKVNMELKLSVRFFTAVTWVVDNFRLVLLAAAPAFAVFTGMKLFAGLSALTKLKSVTAVLAPLTAGFGSLGRVLSGVAKGGIGVSAVFRGFSIGIRAIGVALKNPLKLLLSFSNAWVVLRKALVAVFLTNPVAWLLALGGAFVYVSDQVGGFNNILIMLQMTWNDIVIMYKKLRQTLSIGLPFGKSRKEVQEGLQLDIDALEKENRDLWQQADKNFDERDNLAVSRSIERTKELLESLKSRQEAVDVMSDKEGKARDVLARLNEKYFNSSTMSLREYNVELEKYEKLANEESFLKGKKDVFAYTEELRRLEKVQLNRTLNNNVISLTQFRRALQEIDLKGLNMDLEAGRISLIEYNKEVIKTKEGVQGLGTGAKVGMIDYLEGIGTFAEGMASVVTGSFRHMEESLLEFVKTGKFNFNNFAAAVLDDMTRMIIRSLVLKSVLDAVFGAGGGGSVSGQWDMNAVSRVSAKGDAFAAGGNVIPFAKGGVVTGPTGFNFGPGGSSRGLMGEAGPEAILPLARNRSGDLGVQASVTPVTINIINQSGAEVEQRETTGPNGEKTIELLITNKVREGISSGRFDTAMRSAYGINRKGS